VPPGSQFLAGWLSFGPFGQQRRLRGAPRSQTRASGRVWPSNSRCPSLPTTTLALQARLVRVGASTPPPPTGPASTLRQAGELPALADVWRPAGAGSRAAAHHCRRGAARIVTTLRGGRDSWLAGALFSFFGLDQIGARPIWFRTRPFPGAGWWCGGAGASPLAPTACHTHIALSVSRSRAACGPNGTGRDAPVGPHATPPSVEAPLARRAGCAHIWGCGHPPASERQRAGAGVWRSSAVCVSARRWTLPASCSRPSRCPGPPVFLGLRCCDLGCGGVSCCRWIACSDLDQVTSVGRIAAVACRRCDPASPRTFFVCLPLPAQ